MLNGIGVAGFGWVQRRAPAWPLRATFRDYGEFVVSYLPDPWPGPLAALFPAGELDRLWELVAGERRRELGGAWLAHGDFDTSPIFQADGRYTGLIDFGEIRVPSRCSTWATSSCTNRSARRSRWSTTSSPGTARSLPFRPGTKS